jgi:2-iminobutanoate/2-iminopropanoate deaminase
MEKGVINTNGAPAAIGPYSQAIKAGGFIFTSGQLPADPVSGGIVYGDIKKATAQCIENIIAIAKEEGCILEDVVKTTIYIKNMDDFGAVNEVYGKYFDKNQPARSCIQVAKLPKDADIEIEAIICKG